LSFDRRVWKVLREEDDELQVLRVTGEDEWLWLTIRAVSSGEMLPSQLLRDQLEREARDHLISLDSTRSHHVLGPSLGFVDADGGAYAGVLDLPPSPSIPVHSVLLSATNGVATVLVSVMTDSVPGTPDFGASPFPIFSLADGLLSRFEWPEESP